MLFQKRFHPGLLDGSITVSFRAWKAPRAKVGGRYRYTATEAVEIDAIEPVALASIDDASARRAGFGGAAELKAYLREHAPGPIAARSKVYRVEFHRAAAQRESAPTASADEVAAALSRMDRASRRGPWTRRVLELIEKHPQVASSRLAPTLGRETRAFKADVRKLKRLGLTRSFEVGYELTALGRRCLARMRR